MILDPPDADLILQALALVCLPFLLLFGLFRMGLTSLSKVASVSIRYEERQSFVARLGPAVERLGFRAAVVSDDRLTFEPVNWRARLGARRLSVELLPQGQAVISGQNGFLVRLKKEFC